MGKRGGPGDSPTPGCDDPELVRRAQQDSAAFATLFDCFWELVFRYCHQRLRSWADAEDAAQTAFVQATLHLTRFELRATGGGFRSWLLRIAHNETVSTARAGARRGVLPFPDETLIDPAPGPETVALESAQRDWLADLCKQLPNEQREVIELRFAGAATREIAAALGKSERAVQKSTERAVERLRLLAGQAAEASHG